MSSTSDVQLRPGHARPGARVAVVVSGWPRLSETFALNELRALRRAGMLAGVFATKPGEPGLRHAAAVELAPAVTVLGAGTATSQAEEVATRLAGTGVSAVHGYFAHLPTEVAAAAANLLGVPYGFSVHALDARKVAPEELAVRAAEASWVRVCNTDVAATVAAAGVRPRLIPQGSTSMCSARGRPPRRRGWRSSRWAGSWRRRGSPCSSRPSRGSSGTSGCGSSGTVRCGPSSSTQVRRLGLDGTVAVEPRRAHDALPACYARADLVVVPSVVDAGGDRDGLPNVVLEAMASGRAVVASDVGAIATGVRDGVTGRLVPPGDVDALAAAITELVDRPDLRRTFGARARTVAEARFALADCTAAFCAALEEIHA